MENERKGIKLIELMVIGFVVSLVTSMLVPWLAVARKNAKKRDCVSNLRALGTYVVMYSSTG